MIKYKISYTITIGLYPYVNVISNVIRTEGEKIRDFHLIDKIRWGLFTENTESIFIYCTIANVEKMVNEVPHVNINIGVDTTEELQQQSEGDNSCRAYMHISKDESGREYAIVDFSCDDKETTLAILSKRYGEDVKITSMDSIDHSLINENATYKFASFKMYLTKDKSTGDFLCDMYKIDRSSERAEEDGSKKENA